MSFPSPATPLPCVPAPDSAVAARSPLRVPPAAVACAAATSVGRRDNNEDALLHLPESGLFVVADGMGGYEGGEVASQIVVETLQQVYDRLRADREATFPWRLDRDRTFEENLLAAAIRLANRSIMARRVGRLRDMGATIAALALSDHSAVIGHVGDSRVYRLRGQGFAALTRDHSLYEEVRSAGLSTMQSKRDCPYANVITRALGLSERAEPDVCTVATQRGDLFLICSDGLSDPLPEPKLAELLAAARAPSPSAVADTAQSLIQAAYDAGGRDNISAIVLKLL